MSTIDAACSNFTAPNGAPKPTKMAWAVSLNRFLPQSKALEICGASVVGVVGFISTGFWSRV